MTVAQTQWSPGWHVSMENLLRDKTTPALAEGMSPKPWGLLHTVMDGSVTPFKAA